MSLAGILNYFLIAFFGSDFENYIKTVTTTISPLLLIPWVSAEFRLVCSANRYLEAIKAQPFKRGCKSNDLLGFAAWVNLAFPGRGNFHISLALWTRPRPHICKFRSLLCVSWLILLSEDVLWPSLCFPKIKHRHMFEAGGWVLGGYIATVE